MALPKFGALLVAMPRSVLGGVFIIVCGMIFVSGTRILNVAKNTNANSFIISISLICAICVPIYATYSLGSEWLDPLPIFVKLLLTNSVVLAVILAVSLNLILNIIFKGEEKE
ncbi:hypothetical protein IIC38_16480 [candidate division KSB1 bacterium]|nr:hypothetical protein [candidate division KSB1 bacterium]